VRAPSPAIMAGPGAGKICMLGVMASRASF
jgi:hypothetical protein